MVRMLAQSSVPTNEDFSWFWVPFIAGIAFFVGAVLLWFFFQKLMRQEPPEE